MSIHYMNAATFPEGRIDPPEYVGPCLGCDTPIEVVGAGVALCAECAKGEA